MRGQVNTAACADATVDLYWLPLGAGGHFVRWNRRVYEALIALRERRRPQDLYHSALVATVAQSRFVIEMTPVRDANSAERGVVAEGLSARDWPDGSACFATSSALGIMESSLTSTRQSRVRCISAAIREMPAESSSSCPRCRRLCGVATSFALVRCGTRIRSFRGFSFARVSTATRSDRRREGARLAGRPA